MSDTTQPGSKVRKWGYSFTWTEEHLPREQTDPLQFESDQLGDAALESLQAIERAIHEKAKAQGDKPPSRDIYATLQEHHDDDEVLRQFWGQTHAVPDWVDWNQIERGQKYFSRYALANLLGFGLQGFVAENSASVRVVEVLVRTGGFSTMKLLKRLLETFQWLVQVTDSLPAIQPGGSAHIATIRVRLLHASVRQRMRKVAAEHPKYYDMQRFGLPLNTLDSIHSISTFSCSQMWMQLPRLGVFPTKQEKEDYVALFKYIAYLLGTPHSYFEDTEKARKLMESLYVHELKVTDTSNTVAHNFMECVSNLPWPFYISRSFIEAGSRWINGHELCDQLGLGRPGYFYYVIFAGQCLLSIELAWAQRMFPFLDALVVKGFRSLMYDGLVERKDRARFAMEWVPKLGKQTGKEDHTKNSNKGRLSLGNVQSLAPIGLIEGGFLGVILGHLLLVLATVRLFS
ncbi:hypothetical protein N7508_000727 [Penicillium antarcticum]|uniref:uncharacterized protein n=1 Tax=Penicillium antarcticum TaxID=416450 RepID=UPI0023821B6A|nr:uncharacterized protein N7508_000727 [Penicillium antarcticum]KAJ5320444.1 hypothetical protein N7508_000727 [Penicillium antarcticum]